MIIPVREITPELREAIPHLLALQPAASEILVVPDKTSTQPLPASITILPKSGGPAAKRDFAAQQARSDILAFLDDDAYPQSDWLQRALPHFQDEQVAAVGGPGITPADDGLWAQMSGAVLTSWLGSGPTRMRYWPTGAVRDLDDWPSVNLLVRKDIFERVGGFDTNYWPGEDTKLCLDIIQAGKRIRYDPSVICWHHRATTPLRHLQQVARYGLHRGHFVRKFPQTSRRVAYFLPSLAVTVLLTIGVMAVAVPSSRRLVGVGLAAMMLTMGVFGVVEAARSRRWLVAILYLLFLPLTHLTYGIMFLQGLLAPSLKQYQRSTR